MTSRNIEDFATGQGRLANELAEENPEALLADGLEEAFLGYSHGQFEPARAVYSKSLCVDALEAQGMEADEADEYLQFNTFGAYVGAAGPIFVDECLTQEIARLKAVISDYARICASQEQEIRRLNDNSNA